MLFSSAGSYLIYETQQLANHAIYLGTWDWAVGGGGGGGGGWCSAECNEMCVSRMEVRLACCVCVRCCVWCILYIGT